MPMHKCFKHRNIIMLECRNWTKDEVVWTNGKFAFWKWNISVGHYEKIEKWPPFHKYALYGKFSNYQHPPPPKVSVSGFLSDNGNRTSVLVIMKKLKNGCHFINMHSTENFLKITDHPLPLPSTPKSLGLWFSECQQKWNFSVSHYEKIEKWRPQGFSLWFTPHV